MLSWFASTAAINPIRSRIEGLLKLHPELAQTEDSKRRQPVHYAATCSSPAPLLALMEHKAPYKIDIRAEDANKKTPIMFAAEAGRTENVRILLGFTAASLAESTAPRTELAFKLIFNAHNFKTELTSVAKASFSALKLGPDAVSVLRLAGSPVLELPQVYLLVVYISLFRFSALLSFILTATSLWTSCTD